MGETATLGYSGLKSNSISYPQLDIWLDCKRHPEQNNYTLYAVLTLPKGTTKQSIKINLDTLFSHPDQLWTRFCEKNGKVYQEQIPKTAVAIEEAASDRDLEEIIYRPFDLEKGPLWRLLWIDDHHTPRLFFIWHHLISDAWSSNILLRQFHRSDIHRVNRTFVPYSSYIAAEDEFIGSGEYGRQKEFWRQRLYHTRNLDITTARNAHETPRTSGFSSIHIPISNDLMTYESYTPFQLFCAYVIAYISVFSDERDISIMLPLLNRHTHEMLSIVGNCINTGFLSIPDAASLSFVELTDAISNELQLIMENQRFPLGLLYEEEERAPPSTVYCTSVRIKGESAYYSYNHSIPGLPGFQSGIPGEIGFFLVHLNDQYYCEIMLRNDGDRTANSLVTTFTEFCKWFRNTQKKICEFKAVEPTLFKIKRKPVSEQEIILPEGPLEGKLFEIWKDLLPGIEFGVEHSLFSLGAHSLTAVQLCNRIYDTFYIRLPLGAVFSAPTIREMATYIRTQKPDEPAVIPDTTGQKNQALWGRLSFSQERMYFQYALAPESLAYNISTAALIHGTVRPDLLKEAYEYLIRKFPILRTVFDVDRSGGYQTIEKRGICDFVFEEVSSIDEARDKIADEFTTPFTLAKQPLHYLRCYQFGNKTVIALSMHHIIGDQWTIGICINEISQAYRSLLQGEVLPNPRLSWKYLDYAIEQRNSPIADEDRLLSYWKQRFINLTPFEIPVDRKRPETPKFIGKRLDRVLTEEELKLLEEFSRQANVTPYISMLSALYVLLSIYSGSNDIVLYSPIANRNSTEEEKLLGTFVNTILLRQEVDLNSSYRELVAAVQSSVLSDFAHGTLSFDKIVELINPQRSAGITPLTQVMFNMTNAPLSTRIFDDLTWEEFPIDTAGIQMDLVINAELAITRKISVFYNTDVFEDKTAGQIIHHFLTLLIKLMSLPDKPIHHVEILDPDAQRQILIDWNNTGEENPDQSLREILEVVREQNRSKTALIFNKQQFSYEQIHRAADHIAAILSVKHREAMPVIAVYLDRSPLLIAAILSAIKLGTAYVPLDPSYPLERLQYMLEHSGALFMLTEHSLQGTLNFPEEQTILLDWPTVQKADISPRIETAEQDGQLAYIIYTSGSTGKPKGVEVGTEALKNFLLSMKSVPGMTSDDRITALTPISFDIAGLELFLPLICGAAIVLVSREESLDGTRLSELISRETVSILQATPATYRMLLSSGWNGSVNKILCGGEAFPKELIAPLLDRCSQLWNMYGPTETTIWSSIFRITEDNAPVLIGRPIRNTQMYILDSRMKPVPPGVSGDLYIGGDGLAFGYHNQPELTAAVFIRNPFIADTRIYKTGDKARFKHTGDIEYLGRSDFQIKLNGFRIEPGEIEAKATNLEEITQAACLLKETKTGKSLVLYYIPSTNEIPASADLRKKLIDTLPYYMIPSHFVPLREFPMTSNGKVDRKRFPEIINSNDSHQTITRPETEQEEKMYYLWKNLLRRDDFGIDDDFFALGGHSLLALQFISAIKNIFKVSISLKDFFLFPTVRSLSLHISSPDELKRESTAAELYSLNHEVHNTPVFVFSGAAMGEDSVYGFTHKMTELLNSEYPVFGVIPRGVTSKTPPYSSIEEMAADFWNTIKKAFPEGPYIMIGDCAGGLIAYEILRTQEENIPGMITSIMIDTTVPRFLKFFLTWKMERVLVRLYKLHHLLILLIKNPRQFVAKMEGRIKNNKEMNRKFALLERKKSKFSEIGARFRFNTYKYRIPQISSPITHIINQEYNMIDTYLGWRSSKRIIRISKNVSFRFIPGNRQNRFTTHSKYLAKALLEELHSP